MNNPHVSRRPDKSTGLRSELSSSFSFIAVATFLSFAILAITVIQLNPHTDSSRILYFAMAAFGAGTVLFLGYSASADYFEIRREERDWTNLARQAEEMDRSIREADTLKRAIIRLDLEDDVRLEIQREAARHSSGGEQW